MNMKLLMAGSARRCEIIKSSLERIVNQQMIKSSREMQQAYVPPASATQQQHRRPQTPA
jgi:hypothetical protein